MQPIVDMTASSNLYHPARNHPPRSLPLFIHLLLLLRVLEDTLDFQASPGLLKSPSLNAARIVSTCATCV